MLKQATKDISTAEEHLKGIFTSHKKELSKKHESRSNFSAPPSSPILAENETAFVPNDSLEANKHTEVHAYLGTPYFGQEPCLPVNSTPMNDHDSSAKGLHTCQCCALEFGDSVIETDHFAISGSITKTEKVNRSWDKLGAYEKWEGSDCRSNSGMLATMQYIATQTVTIEFCRCSYCAKTSTKVCHYQHLLPGTQPKKVDLLCNL